MEQSSEPKRRFPRYPCEGDTSVRPNGGWQTLGNALSQISQAGCYIRTSHPYPEGTELDLQLEPGGHSIQVRGVVIYTHESKGMGIVFRQTREEEQALKELLESLGNSPYSA